MEASPQTLTKTGEGMSLKENQGAGTRKRGKDAEHGGNSMSILFLRFHLSICKMELHCENLQDDTKYNMAHEKCLICKSPNFPPENENARLYKDCIRSIDWRTCTSSHAILQVS